MLRYAHVFTEYVYIYIYMQMAQKPQRTESAHKLFFPRTLRRQPLHGVR